MQPNTAEDRNHTNKQVSANFYVLQENVNITKIHRNTATEPSMRAFFLDFFLS
jgi:hypothetical protein